jgi:hypothetical protein
VLQPYSASINTTPRGSLAWHAALICLSAISSLVLNTISFGTPVLPRRLASVGDRPLAGSHGDWQVTETPRLGSSPAYQLAHTILSHHAHRVCPLLGKTCVVDDPRLDRSVMLGTISPTLANTFSSDHGPTKCSNDWCWAAVRSGAVTAAIGSTLLRLPGMTSPTRRSPSCHTTLRRRINSATMPLPRCRSISQRRTIAGMQTPWLPPLRRMPLAEIITAGSLSVHGSECPGAPLPPQKRLVDPDHSEGLEETRLGNVAGVKRLET